jgi:hypothetical protein
LVTLIAGVALGVGATLTFFIPTTPTVLRSTEGAQTVPVTMQDFNDPLPVEVVVGLRPSQAISVGRSGTITA